MKYLFIIVILAACGGSSSDSSSSNNSSPCSAFRILGGEECSSTEIPTVLLEIQTNTGSGICTGTLVNNDFILTAAHCTIELKRAIVFSDRGSQEVSSWIVHPSFDNQNPHFDLALLKVPGFASKSGVTPAKLGFDVKVNLNDSLAVIGYGVNESGDSGFDLPNNNPLATKVQIEILEDGLIGNKYDTTKTNACFGDSGSALYKSGRIVGIESFGTTQTCKEGDINIFADIRSSENQEFLRKHL